jgi:hypothetical protein
MQVGQERLAGRPVVTALFFVPRMSECGGGVGIGRSRRRSQLIPNAQEGAVRKPLDRDEHPVVAYAVPRVGLSKYTQGMPQRAEDVCAEVSAIGVAIGPIEDPCAGRRRDKITVRIGLPVL